MCLCMKYVHVTVPAWCMVRSGGSAVCVAHRSNIIFRQFFCYEPAQIINPRRASQRGLQYLVCHSVCLSVCLSVRHAILAVRATKSITKDTIVLSVRFAAILK